MDMIETGCYEQCDHANGNQPNLTAIGMFLLVFILIHNFMHETIIIFLILYSFIEYKTEFSMWAISASPLQFTVCNHCLCFVS